MKGVPPLAPWRFWSALLFGASIWRPAAGSHPEPSSGGPERLRREVRITVETNPPPAAAASRKPKKAFRVNASWLGWDGLHLELNQRTTLTSPTDPLRGSVRENSNPG